MSTNEASIGFSVVAVGQDAMGVFDSIGKMRMKIGNLSSDLEGEGVVCHKVYHKPPVEKEAPIYTHDYEDFNIYSDVDGVTLEIRDDVDDYPNYAIAEIPKHDIPKLIATLQSYLEKDVDTKTIQSARERFGGNASLPVGGFPDSDKVLNETN